MEIEYLFDEDLDLKLKKKIKTLVSKDKLNVIQEPLLLMQVSRSKRSGTLSVEVFYDKFEYTVKWLQKRHLESKNGEHTIAELSQLTMRKLRELREFEIKVMREMRKQKH